MGIYDRIIFVSKKKIQLYIANDTHILGSAHKLAQRIIKPHWGLFIFLLILFVCIEILEMNI